MVWALERILFGARIDPGLLDHLAVAAVCALAYRDGDSPRSVLERLFAARSQTSTGTATTPRFSPRRPSPGSQASAIGRPTTSASRSPGSSPP